MHKYILPNNGARSGGLGQQAIFGNKKEMQKSTRPPLSEESTAIGFTIQEPKPKIKLLSIIVIFPATKCRPNTRLQRTGQCSGGKGLFPICNSWVK